MNFGKVVIVGCVRNGGHHLPGVLANIELIASQYAKAAFVFIENDSTDNTTTLLRSWSKDRNAHIVSAPGLAQRVPMRTVRLACARNAYLKIVRTYFSGYDHLVALDMDDVNAAPLDVTALKASLDFLRAEPDCAAITANQLGLYYDLWALRDGDHCPGDIWETMLDNVVLRGQSEQRAFDAIFDKASFAIAPDSTPISVDSAFGGLAIYRMSAVIANKRRYEGFKHKTMPGPRTVGLQVCEHVSFNQGLREQGLKIYIMPGLINFDARGSRFAESMYRSVTFDPRLAAVANTEIQMQLDRNGLCPCGSGKRLKHCHRG